MAQATKTAVAQAKDVEIHSGAVHLNGDLSIPVGAQSVVLFAHGSGSSRRSPRNHFVARTIREAGVGTLLFDLLTKDEEAVDLHTAHLRFDIGLLAERLIDATYWVKGEFDYLNVGYFGSSTGGGAALVAGGELGDRVGAGRLSGGRPGLSGDGCCKAKASDIMLCGR